MRQVLIAASALLPFACASSVRTSPVSSPSQALALMHANVVDVERGAVVRDQTILISGSRIISVQQARGARLSPDAQEVDARGLYVIPGLWDMHAHVLGNYESLAGALIPNGVIGVRNPGSLPGEADLDTLRSVRARAQRSTLPLPHLVAAGPLIDGAPPARPTQSVTLAQAQDAAALADSLLAGGVDFFKVYSRLGREPFFAIAAEARRRNVPLTGHVPRALSPIEVSDAGMRSIEHIFEFPLACSTREADMRHLLIETPETGGRDVRMAVGDTVLRTYDRDMCSAIIRRLARNGTFVTPTLYLYKRMGVVTAPTPTDSAIARYFAGGLPQPARPLPEFAAGQERSRMLYVRFAEIVAAMNRGGVRILVGTDTPMPLIWAGFSLHDELRTLVEDGGFTPAEALRAATLNPAQYFAATDSMGTIAPGKLADLVLLSADPLIDIRNTQRVAGVVLGGRYLHRHELDQLLSAAAAKAGRR